MGNNPGRVINCIAVGRICRLRLTHLFNRVSSHDGQGLTHQVVCTQLLCREREGLRGLGYILVHYVTRDFLQELKARNLIPLSLHSGGHKTSSATRTKQRQPSEHRKESQKHQG